ncbi:MAG: PBP1A family penicillin-binding protein [Treponema sp.]|nr:PBP1A family penicillin-binding protein [Treponema sp.]
MENKKVWPLILAALLLLSAILFGALLGRGLAQTVNTQNIENFTDFDTALPTRLLDINGELITEFASDEKREIIAIAKLPQHMLDALVTREDRSFYKHHGYTLKAILRAVVGKLTGRQLGGGSTLTQQIAGTLYCDRQDYSYRRKLQELWWAVQMERRYSKDEILELYLNRIYFGGGTYGVNAASKYYFGHPATEITPAEAAILVIQLSNPAWYNPFEHPNRAKDRQAAVLSAMVSSGYITRGQADSSFDDYWAEFDYTRTNSSAYDMREDEAPWFSEYVRRTLTDMFYGKVDIYTGGFTVNTTVNLSHQKAAQEIMTDYINAANILYKRTMSDRERGDFKTYVPMSELLSLMFNLPSLKVSEQRSESISKNEFTSTINPIIDVLAMLGGMDTLKTEVVNKSNVKLKQNAERTVIEGTMIAIENSTGYIDALVGGSQYSSENQFIRAVQARLQPGSTFKPLYYSAAIDGKNFTMTSTISDTPVVFHKEDGSPYIPQNFKGQWEGDVQLWYALAHSMNVPSLKVLDGIGFSAAIQRSASLLGIPQDELAERHFEPVYPLGLGVCSVRPIELAKAFSTFANNGKEVVPIAIRNVEDRNGNIILNPEKDVRDAQKAKGARAQIISEETAFIMQELLKRTVDTGTLLYGTSWDSTGWLLGTSKVRGSGKYKFRFTDQDGKTFTMPAAGKTGTTQNWADAWTVGFTPYYTAAFWFGFDRPGQSLGLRITGSTLAGVAWGDFMYEANKDKEYKPFLPETPEGLIELEVCSSSGDLLTPECGNHKITAYYFPGTEPTEPCEKHTNGAAGNTLGYWRLQRAHQQTGYKFSLPSESSALTVNLDFLNYDVPSSEKNPGTDDDNILSPDTSRAADDFSNWLLD